MKCTRRSMASGAPSLTRCDAHRSRSTSRRASIAPMNVARIAPSGESRVSRQMRRRHHAVTSLWLVDTSTSRRERSVRCADGSRRRPPNQEIGAAATGASATVRRAAVEDTGRCDVARGALAYSSRAALWASTSTRKNLPSMLRLRRFRERCSYGKTNAAVLPVWSRTDHAASASNAGMVCRRRCLFAPHAVSACRMARFSSSKRTSIFRS